MSIEGQQESPIGDAVKKDTLFTEKQLNCDMALLENSTGARPLSCKKLLCSSVVALGRFAPLCSGRHLLCFSSARETQSPDFHEENCAL